MRKNVKNIAGVSVVEIMIAMVIVSIVLIAIASVFPRMSAHGKAIHESDQARMIAAEVLEGLQMISDSNDPLDRCGTPLSIDQERFLDQFNNTNIGAVTYKVNKMADLVWNCNAATTGFNTVTITVNWRKNNKDHSVKVTGAIR
ncbi:MAG: hypothetical protein FWC23_05750 [Chitinispirillia bacterium]|nr:hypothetical protein [Chitinispirillia bacterium]MCL2268671.1 hypothetical protein [Chitinispirillia bacterium]